MFWMRYRFNALLAALAGAAVSFLAVPYACADLLVSSQTPPTANTVLRYNGTTGAFVGIFASGGGLDDPLGLTVGPDGNLYVASANTNQVLRYNGTTGAFIDVFASGGGLDGPEQAVFGPDGNLYVVSSHTDQVLRYNGTTGAFIDVFVSDTNSAEFLFLRSLTFGPDGNLYVVSWNTASVLRYHGTTGAFMDVFVPSGSGGLFTPPALLFGPDCHLYVTATNLPNPGVFRYNGTTGAFIDKFASFGAMGGPIHFAFGPDGNLYVVTQGAANGVLRFNGTTGAFIDNFVSPGSGGLSNPFGLAFTSALPPVVCTPPTNRCPLSQGFWKNHPGCLAGNLPHLGEPDLHAGRAPGALRHPAQGRCERDPGASAHRGQVEPRAWL